MNPTTTTVGGSIEARTRLTRDGLSIFKRYEGPDQPYYHIAPVNGKPRKHRLCATVNESFAMVRKIRQALATGRYAALDEAREQAAAPVWTVGQMQPYYATAPIRAGNYTRNRSWLTLKSILRRLEPKADPDSHSLAVFADLPRRLTVWAVAQASKAETQRKKNAMLRSCNGALLKVSGLVQPRVLDHLFHEGGISHPALAECYKNCHTFRLNGVPGKQADIPTPTLQAATLAAWETLADRDVFLMVGLELAFGLRKGEAAQARWSWLTELEGCPYLDASSDETLHVKNSSGFLQVRAVDPYYSTFITRARAEGWIAKPEDFIIAGSKWARNDRIPFRVGKWLRALGWKTTMTNHALRDYVASQLMMKYGPHATQTFCRHGSVVTTQTSYSSFLTRAGMINKDLIAARWAVSKPAFTPQIVSSAAA